MYRAPVAGIEVALGKDAGELRSEAPAAKGGTSDENRCRTALFLFDRKENVLAFGNPGSGKTHLLSALGQELIRAGRRVAFTTCVRLGAGSVAGKKELAAEPCDSQTGILRSARDRRPGLCAAEPGRNGSAVHASGGTLRTWQRTNLIESCLLEMGGDLQRSDDDGGRHRSPCASAV